MINKQTNARALNGTWQKGTSGNPNGRPPRATEVKYLTIIADLVTPDTWKEIVTTAIDAARTGDAKAREWLTNYVIGPSPITLAELAAREALDIAPDDVVTALVVEKTNDPTATLLASATGTPYTALLEARDKRLKS